MFVKNQFSAVRRVLSVAHAKSIYKSAKPGSTVKVADANASSHLVLNQSPQDQGTDHCISSMGGILE